jgi:thymidylate synthase (FAD)
LEQLSSNDRSTDALVAGTREAMHVELIAITPDAERVIESAGRTAYLSFDRQTDRPIAKAVSGGETRFFRAEENPGLDLARPHGSFEADGKRWQTIRVWKNSAEKFVEMLVKSGHHSVLEHASATFRIRGASRACTHQLVRHRLASITQQSQRYVSEDRFDYIEPPSVQANPEAHELFVDFVEKARETYQRLQEIGIKNEDARFVLPNAVESEMVITANFREWRHILMMRGSKRAQWEIVQVMVEVLRILKEKAPAVFCDLEPLSGSGAGIRPGASDGLTSQS